ncbi:MAG: glycoside hydrolase family 38 C-terminal domain-containing protein [Anaerolineales bacterium]
MALTLEWRHRIEAWRREHAHHLYTPAGELELEGFITREQLTVDEAARREFAPMPTGTPWGAKWEYAWFRTEVVVPDELAGQRVVVAVRPGGESAIYVNGVAAGALDREHTEVTLVRKAVPGTRYMLMIETYAGHGPRVSGGGPVGYGRESVPEPPSTQAVVGLSTFGVWNEDVYQLAIEVETLWDIREHLDENSLRVDEIDQGLCDYTTIVDFELPYEEMLASVRACRAHLKPLFAKVNGSTTPTMYAFGHSHIDVAWLWPWTETERKCVRTFGTQLALMDEYPEYRFLQSQPHLYWMVKNRYPALYERIKQAVAGGQWVPEGGMWVEADTNLSGGEALVRQFLYGKHFFRQEFGVDSELLWLPDVFGYSGNMPQIMRGAGVKFFATAKIFWAYNGGDPFPFNTFSWEGIDGSTVLVHLCNDYNSRANAGSVIERWNQRVQKSGIRSRFMPFGWGDGGGGPTRDHLESLRRLGNLEGVPQVIMPHPLQFFKDEEARGEPANRYVGELYFQAHRGTLTSQARTKRGNRKSELALREAELWLTAAAALKGAPIPRQALDDAWRRVLLNQFHDIIPGSSIHRVYEEAEAEYAKALAAADEMIAGATSALAAGEGLTVFNSLSWPRSALVELPTGVQGARDANGQALSTQIIDGVTYAEVATPACGWTSVQPTDTPPAESVGVKATPTLLENEHLRVTLNGLGEITSIYDKDAGRELTAGTCNELHLYKDVPSCFDAWDIDSMYALTPVALGSEAKVEVVCTGPLVGIVRVERTVNHSTLRQGISLRHGARRIDFYTEVDWHEQHKMLKVNFPVAIHANEAIHEIQFGHIRRPNHKSRPFDADRFEVANHKWTALEEGRRGCAVLNDCKYGVNVDGNSINLTLLKSPLAPDMTADQGLQEFAYAFYAWNGALAESDLVREGYDLNVPVRTATGRAETTSLFALDAPNVIIDTVKPAEDGSGEVIVRLYEAMRAATECTLACGLPVSGAVQTNLLEEEAVALPVQAGKVALSFRPFELKTVRLKLR